MESVATPETLTRRPQCGRFREGAQLALSIRRVKGQGVAKLATTEYVGMEFLAVYKHKGEELAECYVMQGSVQK